jgi:predicted signal transduction protein with EAL and GGDEF domain
MPFSGLGAEPVGPVTVSIGLAARPTHGTDMQALIDLADKAMYKAKDAGRNRVVLWSNGAHSPESEPAPAESPKPSVRSSRRPAA